MPGRTFRRSRNSPRRTRPRPRRPSSSSRRSRARRRSRERAIRYPGSGAALGAALLLVAGCRRTEAPARPAGAGLDVVLITVDTWRADAAGFAGSTRVRTPAFDRLAAAGRVFTNARAHNVVTLPSHANILTGLFPFQHGIRDNSGFHLSASVPTLATRLSGRGYASGAFVSAFPLDSRWGLGRGFGVYDDRYGKGTDTGNFQFPERPGTETVAKALAWWRAQPSGKRFLWVHVFEPHAPYMPPPPFDAEYRDAPYLGEVAAADAAVSPLLDEILSAPAGSVLAFLTGDHGESLGEHGEETHGLFAYDATLKIPLVVFGLRVRVGRDARPVGHVDIVPTVLDAIGAPSDPALPGRSLIGPDEIGRTLYFEALSASLNRGWAPLTGVLRGGLKYIDLPIRELYDLPSDPKEAVNLAVARDADLRALARALPPEAKQPPRPGTPSAEEVAKLRALGYVASALRRPSRTAFGEADDPKRLIGIDQAIHRIIDHYQRGRMAEAIADAERIVAEYPRLAAVVEQLAFLYQQTDRLPDAARVLKAFFEGPGKEGDAPEALRARYGMVLSEMGRAKEAVHVLSPLASSTDADSLDALGIALADAGDFAAARVAFGRALVLDPSDPRALESLGIVALREKKYAEARAAFRKALDVNPKLPGSRNGLGAAEAALGNLDAALEAWNAALAAKPDDLEALFNLGTTAALAGRPEGAAALHRYLALAPPGRFARERAEAEALLRSLASAPRPLAR
ncbi:MAG: sulfatase-like hydrolase/transferase [Thermoanaerobaculia bacterium]